MARRTASALIAGVTLLALVLSAAQSRRWAQYEPEMQNPADDPPDAWEETEFAFARLRFRSPRDGYWRARWGTDANKSERQFIQGLRRLTRIHARSVEEIVDIDSDDIYKSHNWERTRWFASRWRPAFSFHLCNGCNTDAP